MQNLSCVNEFYLQKKKKSLSYHEPRTSAHFETEVWGNSEMASWSLEGCFIDCHIVKTCGKKEKQILIVTVTVVFISPNR